MKKHTYFMIELQDFEKISEGKSVEDFLPKSSPQHIVLKKKILELWLRADTQKDRKWFEEKLQSIPYKFGEDRDNMKDKK